MAYKVTCEIHDLSLNCYVSVCQTQIYDSLIYDPLSFYRNVSGAHSSQRLLCLLLIKLTSYTMLISSWYVLQFRLLWFFSLRAECIQPHSLYWRFLTNQVSRLSCGIFIQITPFLFYTPAPNNNS